ncbi:alginate lyase family protein [Thioalkalivibrio sp. ALJ16]|uniref:alginate lyase family protein n=1 Tax=Thioalkalivibrio sp. ALJ16 TaxID=1158762 RepID=UPI0003676CCF|nr:alginate lyase family protein [Thioalkalivibrio sp. ALJ16]
MDLDNLPDELKTLYAHRCPADAERKAAYEQSVLSSEPDTFVLYRIIGNDLYPRHAKGQSRQNVRFILENEPELADCEKRWVLNRIFDAGERQAIIELLEQHGQSYLEIPFEAAAFAQIGWDYSAYPEPGFLSSAGFYELGPLQQERVLTAAHREKNLYLMNNNGARNAALEDGRSRAKWVLPWDGNCFVTPSAWEAIWSAVRAAPYLPYFAVPMQRITDNAELLRDDFTPSPVEEPQLLFRRDARERFGENHPYGRRPKVALFWRLGIPGKWDRWKDDPWEQPREESSSDAGAWGVAGWVARLASGKAHLEASTTESFKNRGRERQKAIRAAINHVTREVSAQPDPIGLTSYRFEAIEALRAEHQEQSESGPRAGLLQTLLQNAADALERQPESPVDKPEPGPSGDLQDYYHPAPYWWPNPDTKDGLPYVRRDGERVPGTRMYEPESHRYDRTRLQRLFDDTTTLALAAFVTGDQGYAIHAVRWLERWFIDPATRMNPHLTYAQVRWGHNKNRGAQSGIIEMKDLYYALDAVRLLHHIGALSRDQLERLRAWFREYLDWLLTSEQGTKEAQARNNHGTYYDLQVAAIAAFLDDHDTLYATLARAEERIPLQISPTGIQYEEMTRPITAHYCCFTLQGWLNLLNLAARFDGSFVARAAEPDHPLRKAVEWLLAHEGFPWPYPQIDDFDHRRFQPIKHLFKSFLHTTQSYGESIDSLVPCFSPHDGVSTYWPLAISLGVPVEGASPQTDHAPFAFIIPVIPKARAMDWDSVVANLDNTLASVVNQADSRWVALVVYHDLPPSRYGEHPNIVWLRADFPPPPSVSEGVQDKKNKTRLAGGWLRDQGYDGVYAFCLDADDWVHKNLVEWILRHDNSSGYYINRGYVVDCNRNLLTEKREKFYSYCGSCFIPFVRASELPKDANDKRARFSRLYSGKHRNYPEQARSLGKNIEEVDFPAVAYLINHGESLETRKRGGALDRSPKRKSLQFSVNQGIQGILEQFGQTNSAQAIQAEKAFSCMGGIHQLPSSNDL